MMRMIEVSLTSTLWVLGALWHPFSLLLPLPYLHSQYFWSPHQKGHCSCQIRVQAILMGIFTSSPYGCFSSWRGVAWACETVLHSGCLSCSSVLQGKRCELHDDGTALLLAHSGVSQRPEHGKGRKTEPFLPFCLSFTVFMAPAQAGQAHCGPSRLEWPGPWALVYRPSTRS